jgi:hypothetical protein
MEEPVEGESGEDGRDVDLGATRREGGAKQEIHLEFLPGSQGDEDGEEGVVGDHLDVAQSQGEILLEHDGLPLASGAQGELKILDGLGGELAEAGDDAVGGHAVLGASEALDELGALVDAASLAGGDKADVHGGIYTEVPLPIIGQIVTMLYSKEMISTQKTRR